MSQKASGKAAAGMLLLLAALVLNSGCGGSGLSAGTAAPALEGKTWVTANGQAPDLAGKVHVVEFWFAS